ncbi:hypothetical protein, partial [Thiolapillus sp.]|uniref:hypothetical protein n=1 Tax=Thiolapillus sp. TaxID=2017437 RepID=UPI003AF7768D
MAKRHGRRTAGAIMVVALVSRFWRLGCPKIYHEVATRLMAPAAAADAAAHQVIVAEMQKHCRKMRYRVGIVDAREGMALSEIREFRSNFDDS